MVDGKAMDGGAPMALGLEPSLRLAMDPDVFAQAASKPAMPMDKMSLSMILNPQKMPR